MKGEYSLNVAIPINDAVKRVMEMPVKYGITSIKVLKIVIWILLLIIPVFAWFFYRRLLGTGTPENIALKITIIAGLVLILIGPIFGGLELWRISGKIKIFLVNFSEALGVGNEWI